MVNILDKTALSLTCSHCGNECKNNKLNIDKHYFCCNGCKNVYTLLNQYQLTDYYCLNDKPGITVDEVNTEKYAYLDDESIANSLIVFQNDQQIHVSLHLPQMHCSSCLWLLEHLNAINNSIISSSVNFNLKKIKIVIEKERMTVRNVVELLASIGYEPSIEFQNNTDNKSIHQNDKTYSSKKAYFKIGLSGFAFANIMLISFPEYLGLDMSQQQLMANFFKWTNLLLSIPVVFYCAQEFFINAFYSFKQRYLNIDAPIALAITVTFLRSIYEVVMDTGVGYFDSMTGIVFFMLLGRTLQNRTYTTLSFDKTYQQYFPVAITRIVNNVTEYIPLQDIQVGDVIKIHHQEVIPTDAILSKGEAILDYSFITGEADSHSVKIGQNIYAGAKNIGSSIDIVITKAFDQNSFTQLWNSQHYKSFQSPRNNITTIISRYFSYIVFAIGIITFLFWSWKDPSIAWRATTAILIVACPCALLLAATFTNGYVMDWLSRMGVYLKHADVIELLSKSNHIAFDKTGTITSSYADKVTEVFVNLDIEEYNYIMSMMSQSLHPMSKAIVSQSYFKYIDKVTVQEIPGKGLLSIFEGKCIKIGSREWLHVNDQHPMTNASEVWVSVDDQLKACYQIDVAVKDGMSQLLSTLAVNYEMSLITGDKDYRYIEMTNLFPLGSTMLFNQSPLNKLQHIRQLQENGQTVIMVGDGLNDAGALKQSDIGIAIVKNSFSFSPACDVIMSDQNISMLDKVIDFCKASQKVILFSFLYSIIFNIIGLSYAVTGALSPLIAAIIMPSSSLGIILISYIGIRYYKNNYFK